MTMNANLDSTNRVRVSFKLEQDEDGYPPFGVERLWAVPTASGTFLVDNIPFYVYGLGTGDEVSATKADNGELWFDSLVKSSGVSIFRVYAKNDLTIKEIRGALLDLSCPSEIDQKMGIIAVEIPLACEISSVLNYFMAGQENSKFDFEEGVLRHELPY